MSNKRTLQLLSAASAAIPAPIVPEPKTATEFISLFISIPFYKFIIAYKSILFVYNNTKILCL